MGTTRAIFLIFKKEQGASPLPSCAPKKNHQKDASLLKNNSSSHNKRYKKNIEKGENEKRKV